MGKAKQEAALRCNQGGGSAKTEQWEVGALPTLTHFFP